MKTATLRILLTGGGSGGHIYPLVAVAEEIKRQSTQGNLVLEMQFVGDGQFSELVRRELGVEFRSILSPKWRRYFSFKNFLDILKIPIGFLQTIFYIWRFMPDLIFSKGGYDSFFPTLVGALFMVPVIIHESDAVPGKANAWASRWAKKIFTSFDSAKDYFKKADGVELVGNPIRNGIVNLTDRMAATGAFSLGPSKPTILVTGASQGAQVINGNILSALVELTKKFQIIHQCGDKNYNQVNSQILSIVKEGEGTYGKVIAENYRLYPSFDLQQMALAYSAADAIVARAGSGTIFEIAAMGKPMVLIPLKGSAGNHQLANARELAKFGAVVIEEDNLTPHILINEIETVYRDREQISLKIKQFAKPDASRIIAQQLLGMSKDHF